MFPDFYSAELPEGSQVAFQTLYAQLRSFLATSFNEDGTLIAATPDVGIVPIGTIVMYGGAAAPANWLLCDGTAVSRVTYKDLFAAIGVAYGSGDGSTTFNLPDNRQRFPLGKAAAGTGATLGDTGGNITQTLTSGALSGSAASATATISGSTGSTSVSITGTTAADGDHTHSGATGNEASHTHATTTPDQNDGKFFNLANAARGIDFSVSEYPHAHPADTSGAGSSHNHSISASGTHTHGAGSLAGSAHTHAVGTLSVDGHVHAAGTLAVANTAISAAPYLAHNFIILAGV